MANVKQAVFTDEDDTSVTSVLEDLTNTQTAPISEDEEIESMFSFEPIKVDEVLKKEFSVDVMPIRDYSFSFGGTWYYLNKGKSQTVPVAVRDFLLKNKTNPKIKDVW
jgi:hypothetical protein